LHNLTILSKCISKTIPWSTLDGVLFQ